MTRGRVLTPEEVSTLVRRAAEGDRGAWEALVDCYLGLVWSIVRRVGVAERDQQDVVQTTWLRFLEHIDDLHDPSKVGPWLATTTRRECWRVVAEGRRTVLVDDDHVFDVVNAEHPSVEHSVLRAERDAELHDAVDQLPVRWRDILTLLMADPAPSYDEICAALDVPHGTIGPTRARCLRRLREVVTA
jgi:RNA polymerase sigma factor (sigma-70 family)